MDGVGVAGVEGESNHRFLLAQVDANHAVVVSHLARTQFLVILRTVVNLIVMFHLVVGNPDRAQTGCLRGHDVDAVAEVDGKVFHTGAGKLKHLVLHEAIVEHGFHQRDSHIVGADALTGSTFEPY